MRSGAGGEGGLGVLPPQSGGVAGTGGDGLPGGLGGGGNLGIGGAAHTAGAGGVASTCVPKVEDCFNGTDDDCDTQVDCADSNCDVGATCLEASGGTPGLLVPNGTVCPSGVNWASSRLVHAGLQASAGCKGCGCTVSNVTCVPTLFVYAASESECILDTALTGGSPVFFEKPLRFTPDSPSNPQDYTLCELVKNQAGTSRPFGARLAKFDLVAKCETSGLPQTEPPTWASSALLCTPTVTGAGCGGGVCVPRTTFGTWTAEASKGACSGKLPSRQTWYSGVKDERVCGSCACSLSGGGCGRVSVRFGNDYGCHGPDSVHVEFPKKCGGMGYSPGASLYGEPGAPACASSSAQAGSVLPSGPTTICAP